MSYERFITEVRERSGLGAVEEAARAAEATLGALRQRLVDDEAEALARELPEELAQILRGGAYDADFGVEELYRRVRDREGIPLGRATELAQVVCQALAGAMSAELRLRLSGHLPADLAELLTPRAAPPPPPAPEHREREAPPGEGRTLSGGRPGSHHPLSEAHPDRAHEHSVVREDNPHGETKISSSPGLTQERLGDDLAGGRPGPAQPIHSAKR